jgi:hypothetical protein
MDDWLEKTYTLQLEAYGNDLHALSKEELREYLRWNHTAAVVELSEMIEETRWKTWVEFDPETDDVIINKRSFIKEAVDAGHFIANMLVAGGVTDKEYWDAYLEKMETNRERQRRKNGYQSRRGVDKCTSCGRSFDDVGRAVTDAFPDQCATCEKEAARGV